MRPEILLHSPLPRPMHDVSPCGVMGAKWWKEQRRIGLERARGKCEACGEKATRLEGHENYSVDYASARMRFTEVTMLCPPCHKFIHSNRLAILAKEGVITEEYRAMIMRRGNEILSRAGLVKKFPDETCLLEWGDWRLEFNGLLYPPKHASSEALDAYYKSKIK